MEGSVFFWRASIHLQSAKPKVKYSSSPKVLAQIDSRKILYFYFTFRERFDGINFFMSGVRSKHFDVFLKEFNRLRTKSSLVGVLISISPSCSAVERNGDPYFKDTLKHDDLMENIDEASRYIYFICRNFHKLGPFRHREIEKSENSPAEIISFTGQNCKPNIKQSPETIWIFVKQFEAKDTLRRE